MNRRITQKEIARRLGVSQALVSRSLTGRSGDIAASPVTVERIRKAAMAWKYAPNAAAMTLKGAPTRTLGVIIKSFDDPFFGHLIGELQGLARAKHYALLLAGWTEGASDPADEMMLRKYQPDGLIVCGSDYRPSAVQAFLNEGKPVVQIGMGATLSGVRQVGFDEEAGLNDLSEYLFGLGHIRIGYVGGDSVPHRRREKCLRAILSRRGVGVPVNGFATVADLGTRSVTAALRRLLDGRHERCTALIAADDATAQTVLRALYEEGMAVPESMSLAGMDDIPSAQTMIPALTTVRLPVEEMVQHAFRMVTGANGPAASGSVVVAPKLVVRESCAPPRE